MKHKYRIEIRETGPNPNWKEVGDARWRHQAVTAGEQWAVRDNVTHMRIIRVYTRPEIPGIRRHGL